MRRLLIILGLFVTDTFAQVQFIAGSYATATAYGSGTPGLPTLNYTTLAGADRLLIFTLVFERDHGGAKGSNWADPKSVGGADPVVTYGVANMTKLRAARYYQYQGAKEVGNATMTMEMIIYGILEASIPAGNNDFIVSGINNPGHSGDEAIMSAMMFENVVGVTYLGSNGCEDCNAISLAGLDPLDADNMIISFIGAGSDRDINAGAGFTLAGNAKNANASGDFDKFSEQDGIAFAAEYITGTSAIQSADFSLTGAANVFGNVEVGFRLVSNVVLPVELLSFEGRNEGSDNTLFWSTATEINNDRFEIERSDNGFIWDKLDEVYGTGTNSSVSFYQYTDMEVNCTACYYRLKQIDFDGTYEYSPVVILNVKKIEFFKIYPNPATHQLTIELSNINGEIYIIDSKGQTVKYFSEAQFSTQTIDISDLSRGHYYVVLKNQGKINTERLVKL